ncbi:MAG: diacylglycerol kinase family protein [Bacteroidetes bacterium]|nr:diacylglycerol kinase family protein [Bacteroidota bacterium]
MKPKPFSINERIGSFKPAIAGLMWFFKKEHNVRIHIFVAILAILGGLYFHISNNEWLVIILCIGIVLTIEALNSAIEKLVDLFTIEKNSQAGLIKDLAAGAVLISSIMALIAAVIIFFPKIMVLFFP